MIRDVVVLLYFSMNGNGNKMESRGNRMQEKARSIDRECVGGSVWCILAYSTVGQSVNTCIPIYIDWMLAAENDIDLNK